MMTMTRFANDESLLIQAQNGDSEAVELYLSAFVPFLNTIAKRFFNPVLSSQELCQAGYIGLMLALQRYDDTQNVHFMTYAMPWVLGEMKKALRHASDLSEGQQRSQSIAQQLGKLSSILGREPRIDELADFCKTNPSEIIWALEGGCVPQSLDHPCEENGKTLALKACFLRSCRRRTGFFCLHICGLWEVRTSGFRFPILCKCKPQIPAFGALRSAGNDPAPAL